MRLPFFIEVVEACGMNCCSGATSLSWSWMPPCEEPKAGVAATPLLSDDEAVEERDTPPLRNDEPDVLSSPMPARGQFRKM